MTIQSQTRTAGPFIGSGAVVPYPFNFKVFQPTDLMVVRGNPDGSETMLTMAAEYNVTLNSDQETAPGGIVQMVVGLPSGYTLLITSAIPEIQKVLLTNQGGFYPRVISDALDYLTILIQQLRGPVSRSLKLPISDDPMSATLPTAEARAGGLLGFDSAGRPIVTAPGSETATGVAVALASFISNLFASTGASLMGFIQNASGAIRRTVLEKLRDSVNVLDFGADPTGATSSSDAFNKAIEYLANRGGGTVFAGPGVFFIQADKPILWCREIALAGRGARIKGDGTGDLVHSGWMQDGVLIDIVPLYGTGGTGEGGAPFVGNASIYGFTLSNAKIGIRGTRLNYGTTIEKNVFEPTLETAWLTTHSWGLKVHQNTVYAKAIMRDFVDWTEVSGNSFEGPGTGVGIAALEVGTGGWGGSYTARFISNGFHHYAVGISFTSEADNAVIESNHFEDTKFHVVGNGNLHQFFRIRNNWMKANLLTGEGGVIAVSFGALTDSEIGPNKYSTDGVSGFDAHVLLQSSDCFGNAITLPYSPANDLDLTLYQVNNSNKITLYGGSNNGTLNQPQRMEVSGSGGYTIEKYRAVYNRVANQIPECTVEFTGGNFLITTWIPSENWGILSTVEFNFRVSGPVSYNVCGRISGRFNVTTWANEDLFSGGSPRTITPTNFGGVMRISINVPDGGNISGWVKEI